MHSKKLNLNTKGFSLIELMIVVAIIGLLAAIGIPQYAKFQAKARQAEAKGHLTGIYTAEQSFQSEWSGYTSNLVSVGYSANGTNLRYTVGFAGTACTTTGRSAGAPAENAGNTQVHLTTVTANTLATWNTLVFGAAYGTTAVGLPAITCDASNFIAFSYGDPKNTPTSSSADQWSVNQVKTITNIQVGL